MDGQALWKLLFDQEEKKKGLERGDETARYLQLRLGCESLSFWAQPHPTAKTEKNKFSPLTLPSVACRPGRHSGDASLLAFVAFIVFADPSSLSLLSLHSHTLHLCHHEQFATVQGHGPFQLQRHVNGDSCHQYFCSQTKKRIADATFQNPPSPSFLQFAYHNSNLDSLTETVRTHSAGGQRQTKQKNMYTSFSQNSTQWFFRLLLLVS